MENPYYAGKEVTGKYFFNRKNELEEAILLLTPKEAVNIAIVGSRRIGKTSFQLKAGEILREKNCLPILIKCETLFPQDPKNFFENLIKELLGELRKLEGKFGHIKDFLSASKEASLKKIGLDYDDISFWIDLGKREASLKEIMDKTFGVVEKISDKSDKKVVIFLDEFQSLYQFG